MKLGNDFTNEDGSDKTHDEESDEKTIDDESKDEKDNSADTDDSKKDPEESDKESVDNVSGDDADAKDDDSKDDASDKKDETSSDDSEDDKKEPDKAKVLQGLLETEKEIDGDLTNIDESITAARKRISDKRKDRREGRDLVDTIDTKFPDTKEEETDDLSDIDSETLKVLDRYTKSKGLVPKSELAKMSYQQQHKVAEDSFYASHPEYLPENDTKDVLYNAIKKELKYFATPSDAKLIPALFEKAHNQVLKLYPDKFKAKKVEKKSDTDDTNKIVRIKTRGLGGSSGGGADSGAKDKSDGTKKVLSETQVQALRDGGWDEEDIKRLTNK